MATLADINQTLVRVDDNTENTSRGITSFLKQMAEDKRKQLEASREQKQAVADVERMQGQSSAQSSSGGGGGLLGGVKNMLAGASMATLASTIGRGLVKRVLGPAVIAGFAEEIVEFLLPEGFENQAIKDALTGGLQGAAIGFMVGGPLGAAIGGGIGALLKNEKFKKAVEDLGGELKQMGKDLYEKLEPTVINFKNSFLDFFDALGITKEGVVKGLALALTTIGDAAAAGVTSLTNLIKGDFEPMDIVKGIGLLGTVAALLMPGKFMKLFGLLAGIAAKGGGKVFSRLLGGAGATALTTATTAAAAAGTVVMSKSGNKMIAGADGKATTVKAPAGAKVGDKVVGDKVDNFKKFPRLGKAARFLKAIPGMGYLLALGELATMNPLSVDGVAGVLGGLGGTALGALAATFIPGIPGINQLIGGTVGYFLGDALFKGLAQFLLGKKVTAFPDFMNDIFNSKEGTTSNQPRVGTDAMRMGRGNYQPSGDRSQMIVRHGKDARTLKSNISQPSGMSPGAMGGSTAVVNSGNTTNTVNNSQGLVLGNKTTTSDKDDPFSLSNQIKSVGGSAAFGF